VTHSPVVSCSVSRWNIYINLQHLPYTVSKVLLQPAGVSLIPVRSLSVPIMGCAVGVGVGVGVEIGDASPWLQFRLETLLRGRSSVSACPWKLISIDTLPSPENTKLSYPSLSLHAMIMSQHQVQHPPKIDYLSASIPRFLRLQVNP